MNESAQRRPSFSLVLTHACNLACSYCYMGEHLAKAMPRDVADRALDFAFAYGPSVDIGFFGGEPLLAYPLLVHVVKSARARAEALGGVARFQVTTNGVLVTRDVARELRALGVRVTLSLDGTREAHDAGRPRAGGGSSFDAVMRGAKNLMDEGHPLEVICVVSPANVRALGESTRALAAMGASRIVHNPAYEAAWSDADLEAWERGLADVAALWQARMREGRPLSILALENKIIAAINGSLTSRDRCSTKGSRLAIAPSGRIYPCDRLVKDDRDARFAVGSLDRGLDAAKVLAIPQGPAEAECAPCPERWRCSSTCACANVAETGEPHMPGGVQCWYEQTVARVADEASKALLAEGCAPFVAWAYSDAPLASTASPSPAPREKPVATLVRRRHLGMMKSPR